jgi:hypothetical protein
MTHTASASPPEDEDLRIEAMAQERATGECMRGRGFQYVVALPNDVLIEEAINEAAATGGDVDAAAEAVGATLPPDPNEDPVSRLPEATQEQWYNNLFGTDTILACADAHMRGSAQAQQQMTADQALSDAATASAKSAATVRAAAATYVTCMGASGYTVADTDQITEIVSTRTEEIIASEPWPADLPDELPADATAAEKARWEAANARVSKAEADAEAFTNTANTAHEACVAPYNNAFDEAYRAALPA